MKNEHKKSEMTFYSARGIMLMIAAVLIFATIAVIGMYRLGVISIPDFISDVFDYIEPESVKLVMGLIKKMDRQVFVSLSVNNAKVEALCDKVVNI